MKWTAAILALAALCILLSDGTAPAQSKASPAIPGFAKRIGDEIRARRKLEEAYLSLAIAATGGDGTSLAFAEAVNAETTHPRAPRLGNLFGGGPAIRAIPLRGSPARIRIGETDWTPLGALRPGWSVREADTEFPAGLYLVGRSGARAALLRLAPDEHGLPRWSVRTALHRFELAGHTSGPAAVATFPGGNDRTRVVLRTEEGTITLDLKLMMPLL